MNADGITVLDLEAGALKLVNKPAQRSRGVSTWEDVFVHEQTPDEILVLPRLAETSNLQVENTIILQHVVDLLQELAKVTDTDVLSHLQTGDLVVAALRHWGVSVVHTQDVALFLGDADLAKGIVAPCSLVPSEGDTSSLGAVVDTGETGERAPAAAEIEKLLARLQADLLAHNSQLVVLQLLQSLFLVDVGDNTGSVDHAWAQEPGVEVIATVVVLTNLLLI